MSEYTIQPIYKDYIELIEDMDPNELDRFNKWFGELEDKNNGEYYASPLSESTGIKCWLDYFVDGYEPLEALECDLEQGE